MSDTHLAALLDTVTDRAGRGPAAEWTVYDFEAVSEDIYTITETRLSVTTLKRVFGRLKYDGNPSTSTLNALAGYAGYLDWRAFEQQTEIDKEEGEGPDRVRDQIVADAGAGESRKEQSGGSGGDKPLEWPLASFFKINLALLLGLAVIVTAIVILFG